MSKNKKTLVYSTNKNIVIEENEIDVDLNLDKSSQVLRLRLETKQRAGKRACIVSGFVGSSNELDRLAKLLKTKLGVGGSAKDGEIIIQGDLVTKTKEILINLGYKNTK